MLRGQPAAPGLAREADPAASVPHRWAQGSSDRAGGAEGEVAVSTSSAAAGASLFSAFLSAAGLGGAALLRWAAVLLLGAVFLLLARERLGALTGSSSPYM